MGAEMRDVVAALEDAYRSGYRDGYGADPDPRAYEPRYRSAWESRARREARATQQLRDTIDALRSEVARLRAQVGKPIGWVVVRQSDGSVFTSPIGGWFATRDLAEEAAAQRTGKTGIRHTVAPIGRSPDSDAVPAEEPSR